jgi:hypothetical protein
MMIEFELKDKKGNTHKYQTNLFGASEGLEIFPKVMASVGAVVKGIKKSLDLKPELLDAAQKGGVEGVLTADSLLNASVDFTMVGEIIQEASLEILKAGESGLLKKVLRHTLRDGKPVPECFDYAYQANYIELFQAVQKVVILNWGN